MFVKSNRIESNKFKNQVLFPHVAKREVVLTNCLLFGYFSQANQMENEKKCSELAELMDGVSLKKAQRGTSAVVHEDDYSPLVHINDDCLFQIFSYLNVYDAVNVASTCKRLQCFAKENHYQKFIKFELKPRDVVTLTIPLKVLQTVFQQIGHIVEEIYVDGNVFCGVESRLKLVLHLCPNLHSLRVRNLKFQCDQLFSALPNTSAIKVLEISDCDGDDGDYWDVISNFQGLQSLIITANNRIFGGFLNVLENLNSLELLYCPILQVLEFKSFCESNGGHLRKLKLVGCKSLHGGSFFPMILNKMTQIEELTIDENVIANQDELNSLTQLNHLKKLVLVNMTDTRFSPNLNLEFLEIIRSTFDVRSLDHFQRLQTLRLVHPNKENGMMDAIVNADLPQLREFYFKACELNAFLGFNDTSDLITDANLVAFITSKRTLTSVDILFCKPGVTFAAVRQIINVLRSDLDGHRSHHLTLNIYPFEIGVEEVNGFIVVVIAKIITYLCFFFFQEKFLNANRHLITVTNVIKSSELYDNDKFEYDDISEPDWYGNSSDEYCRSVYNTFNSNCDFFGW